MAKKKPKKKQAKKVPFVISPIFLGTVLLGVAFLLFLSLASFSSGQETSNWLGLLGHGIGWLFHTLFGISSYFLVIFVFAASFKLLGGEPLQLSPKALYVSLFTVSLCMLFSLIEAQFPLVSNFLGKAFYQNLWSQETHYHLGGTFFYYIYLELPSYNLHRMFNTIGMATIFSCTLLASFLGLTNINPLNLISYIISLFLKLKNKIPSAPEFSFEQATKTTNPSSASTDLKVESDFMRYVKLRIAALNPTEVEEKKETGEFLGIQPETNLKSRPSLSKKETRDPIEPPQKFPSIKEEAEKKVQPKTKRETALNAQAVYNGDFTNYQLPPATLLTTPKKIDQSSLKSDLKKQAEVLEETLLSFGIEAKVGEINCGPTITSFEVHPSIGVKVQKIKALENDIALNMEAKSIRIIAPIPGKAAVGIEVPNQKPQEVGFKDMLLAYQQSGRRFNIPVLLGKAANGDYVMSDLSKMPHCIIAGATGSGKSVCINTIVMSIVHNAKPDEIRLIMVDPKKVELTGYSKLPHMLAPVITEPRGASAALNFLVKEMERRYELLKNLGLRNIEAFNTRKIDPDFEASLDLEIPAKMHYIVAIIDELADLMMVASSDIETPIARIAQMARAVGIHLILATQRPSREVITGLIKANFPTRISFKVASRVNSQIVLDEIGAESLLGNGDMLFLPPGSSHLLRAQGAFIRDEDINATVQFISEQAPPNYVIQSFDHATSSFNQESGKEDEEEEEGDNLYQEALNIVLSTGNASTTFLQRKLKIGYARAASLMDLLEKRGIVSAPNGSKARKVLGKKSGLESDKTDTENDNDDF